MKQSIKTRTRETSLSVLREVRDTLQVIASGFGQVAAKTPEPVYVPDPAARFVKLDGAGKPVAPSAKTWSAVRDTKLGLDWSAEEICEPAKWEAAKKACAELTLCGTKNWRLPTVEELFLLVDRSRRDPAIDITFFPSCKSTWYWTSTPYAGDSDYAWSVYFFSGDCYWSGVSYDGRVRACRPSQS